MPRKSFLKWAGGKSKSLSLIESEVYSNSNLFSELRVGRFIEPFVGSGVVFINIEADEYIINDINKDLTNLYKIIKTNGDKFISECKKLFTSGVNNEEDYYNLRTKFNNTEDVLQRSVLFMYLNRHCFNGLCRYNKSGKFNVPFGRYNSVHFPEKALNTAINRLDKATIYNKGFEKVIALAKEDDVVYCVPEDTLIYQDGNYLPIKDVTPYETDLGNNNKCVKKHIRPTTNEEIIQLNIMGISKHYDLELSKNHVVFVYEKETDSIIEKKATHLTTSDLLVIDYAKEINNFIPVYKKYNKSNKKMLNVNYNKHTQLAELLGLYMAEGHLQNGIILSFSANETDLHLLTKKLIRECFGLEATIHPKSPHDSVTQVKCYSKELEQYILEFYTGANALCKRMKGFVMCWDKDIQLSLLRGWLKGDGGVEEVVDVSLERKFVRTDKRNKFKYVGTSASFELSSQMYNIALRCGLHPCFKKRITKRRTALADGRTESVCYDVYFTIKKDIEVIMGIDIPGRNCGRRFHTNGYMVTRINSVSKKCHTGNMYDLTTTNGYFWCMGNVKVHNCDPPYVPISDTASFTDYTSDGFTMEQQKLLAKMAEESRCKFLISNHDTEVTRELYKKADYIIDKKVNRFISAKSSSRVQVSELLAVYERN